LAELTDGVRITARIEENFQAPLEMGQELSFVRVDENGVYWFRQAL
jgi:hypothetical protein